MTNGGFGDEDDEDPDLVEPSPALKQGGEDDDGWGFDDDDDDEEKPLNVAAAKPATKLMKGKQPTAASRPTPSPSQNTATPNVDEDSWGFDNQRADDKKETNTPANGMRQHKNKVLRLTISKHSHQLVHLASQPLQMAKSVSSCRYCTYPNLPRHVS